MVYQDDTGARVLSLIKENQADPPPERKAMYTTVLRFEGKHTICLYFTGRCHAGENLDTILAHRDPNLAPIQPLRARYVTIPAEVPPGLDIERVDIDRLPADWRDPAALETLRTIGSEWAARLLSAVLAVPSAVVPTETTYLLNPRHPDFGQILIGEPQEIVTDLRLSQLRRPDGE